MAGPRLLHRNGVRTQLADGTGSPLSHPCRWTDAGCLLHGHGLRDESLDNSGKDNLLSGGRDPGGADPPVGEHARGGLLFDSADERLHPVDRSLRSPEALWVCKEQGEGVGA